MTKRQEYQRVLMQRIEEDRKMMSNPERWPTWPMLPLKMRNGHIDDKAYCAFLLSFISGYTGGLEVEPLAYIASMHEIRQRTEMARELTGKHDVTWKDILATMEQKRFDNLDALLEVYTVD